MYRLFPLVSANLVTASPAAGVLDFVGGFGGKPPSEVILVARADLDQDETDEWFISTPLHRDGKAGLVWMVFRESGDGLKGLGHATFHGGVVGETEAGWGIYDLFGGGARHFSIIRTFLSGGQIRSEKVDEVVFQDGEPMP